MASLQGTLSTAETINGQLIARGSPGNGISDITLNNDYTLTITMEDGTTYTTASIRGETGEGVPSGGTAGQVLMKASATDYDTEWADLEVDSALSSSSENPVQNKAVYEALADKADASDVPTATSDLTNDSGFVTDTMVFIATYGTTTSSEIETAYQAGKVCLCNYNGSVYYLSARGSSYSHDFTLAGPRLSSTSDYNQVGYYYVECYSSVWNGPNYGYTAVPLAATSAPSDLGTAAVGSSARYAKEDHVHNMPDADDIDYDNTTSGLSATDVQSAIDELASGSGGGTTEVFWATYGTTTSAEIETAYQAGKLCLCSYNSYVYILERRDSATHHYFYCAEIYLDDTDWSVGTTYLECTSNSWSGPNNDTLGADIALSASSTAPVQNAVVYAALANKADSSDIPTATSDLTNDSGYITDAKVYWATYGTTTSAEIETAWQAGKLCVCLYSDNLYILAVRDSATDHLFYVLSERDVYVNNQPALMDRYLRCASDYWSNYENYDHFVTSVNGSYGAVTISVPDDASDIAYDNTTSGLSATDVQDAIDEIAGDIPTATSDLTNDSGFITDAGVTSLDGQTGAVVSYGVCDTAAGTAAKTVTISGLTITTGVTIHVKFTYANSVASPTLNVNSTGAIPIYRYGTTAPSTTSTSNSWAAGAVLTLTYDGTGWIEHYWYNTTYTLYGAYCTTSASTAAKTASCTYYALNEGWFELTVRYANTYAGALTLNVASKGALPIYINGTVSSASNYTLPAGLYFVYCDGSAYYFRTDGKLEGVQEELTFDSTPTSGSTNPVTSGGVYTALAGKEDTLTFDSTPTSGSTNPVTSGGVYTALADKQSAIEQGSITTTTSWSGSDPYTQTVTVSGVTVDSNSKVDLQPDSTAIAQMVSDGCTGLYVSNTSGVLTLYAVGASLTAALTIQCTVTEVS